MGRIISVREYDLKPGINIGSRTHSRDTEARGLLQLPGLVAHHVDPLGFLSVLISRRTAPRCHTGRKSTVDRAVQTIQPELPSGLYARQR